MGGGKIIASELVVAGGDAPPILDAAEEVLDFVSPPVEALGAIGFLRSGVRFGLLADIRAAKIHATSRYGL